MPKKTYSELLKDPQWQRKRLEIMQRDEFTCQMCRDKETTLHVHHKRYVKGRMPWEYEDDELVTLCWPCHEGMHAQFEELMYVVARLAVDGPHSSGEATGILAGWAHGYTGHDFQEYQFPYGRVNFALGEIAAILQTDDLASLERLRDALYRVNRGDRWDALNRLSSELLALPVVGMEGQKE